MVTAAQPSAAEVTAAKIIAPDATEMTSTSEASPGGTQKSTAENLRRTSSKIANLRAAFENRTLNSNSLDPLPKRRVSKSPARPHEYEAEIARLKDQWEKEVELRQAYEEKCTVLEEENEELNKKLQNLGGADVSPNQASDSLDKSQAREDISSLHRQLAELKRSISAATHVESQVTDSTFSSEMGILQSEIQNWTVQNFRRAKTDTTPEAMCARLMTIADRRQQQILEPVFRHYQPSLKLAMLQTVIVSYLMEVFEDPLLFGLSAQDEWRKSLKNTADALPSVLAPAAFNKWRAVTLNCIRQCDSIQASVDSTALGMAEIICVALGKLTETEDHESRVSSLKTIVKRSISLAHLFRVQRARYAFELPLPDTPFDPDAMEDISVDGESRAESPVLCATFPSVTKLGDENGENMQISIVVLKARVVRADD